MKLLFQITRSVFPYFTAIFLILIGFRSLEFIRAPAEYFGESVQLIYFTKGIFIDLLVSLILTSITILIQFPFSYFFKSSRNIAFHIVTILLLIVHFFLNEFFLIANEPLNDSIFFLTYDELLLIGGSGDRISFSLILTIITTVIFYFAIGWLIKKLHFTTKFTLIFSLVLLGSVFLAPVAIYKSNKSNVETLFVNNRLASFCSLTLNFFWFNSHTTFKQANYTRNFDNLDPNFFGGESLSKEYPLMHNLSNKREFSDLFTKRKKDPPNIVFIIVESLSTSLVGEKADKTGHLMPFLDSLSEKSLYFPNFLSTCERTHNVLPAALSSVPNAPDKNMFMQMEYPLHWSLISLLKKDYYSRFYCGVDLSYFNMNSFMNCQQTSYLVKNWGKSFGTGILKDKNSWGYNDGQLFDKSWKDFKHQSLKNKRRLDVFLTISTHDPYKIPNQNKYINRVVRIINEIKNPTKIQLDIKQNAKVFSTYAFLDDQLRTYFKKAKQQPNYKNTLFFVFGDHGNEYCQYDELERFKIPLIIYSPLLKKPKTIRSVSTHLDLAPTIINYLRTQYKLFLPEKVPFIGKELSLKEKYECKRTLPFNTTGWENLHLLNNNFFLHHNQLFGVENGLSISKIDNKKEIQKHLNQLQLYNLMSKYTIFGDKIIPKHLFSKYSKIEVFHSLLSYQKLTPTKEDISTQFINIGENINLSQKTNLFKINFSCDIHLKSLNELKKIPSLAIALTNVIDEKKDLILWKLSNPQLINNFKPKQWNKIQFSITIRLKDYKKELKNGNILSYYLLNMDKKYWKIKNFNTLVSSDL